MSRLGQCCHRTGAATPSDMRGLHCAPVGCMILAFKGCPFAGRVRRCGASANLVSAAHLELVSGVVHLRPDDAVLEANLCDPLFRNCVITRRANPTVPPMFDGHSRARTTRILGARARQGQNAHAQCNAR